MSSLRLWNIWNLVVSFLGCGGGGGGEFIPRREVEVIRKDFSVDV